jgi:hypothetical protein
LFSLANGDDVFGNRHVLSSYDPLVSELLILESSRLRRLAMAADTILALLVGVPYTAWNSSVTVANLGLLGRA